MKPFFFAAALALTAATAAQAQTLAPTDTIVVKLPNQAVMMLMVRDAQQLRQLPQYHLDSLVARLGSYIKRADEAAKAANTERVTTDFFPDKEQPGQGLPDEIRITTSKSQAAANNRSSKVEVLLEKRFGFTLDTKGGVSVRTPASRAAREARRDSTREAHIARHSVSTTLVFDLGLNALVNKGSGAPDLRTLGSRYVNLGFNKVVRLGGPHSPAYVVFGPEFAFNNYMLEGNNKWVNQNGATSVVLETNGRQYQKTKLATSTFTVPLMLHFKLRDEHHRETFTLSAGAFGGYRLGSWTKLKYFEEGNTYKDKDYSNYNLNAWQYGLQGAIGYKSLTFFAKYNLNPLFRDGKGPQAQTLSFGLRIFGI